MKKKMLLLILLPACMLCVRSYAQKKYGYVVLELRCGKQDPQRNKVYFSPIIELNVLNFDHYTEGIDPGIPKYSVRFYNYAIAKWFEQHLLKQYSIAYNDPEKYERGSSMVVFNKAGECNADKTSIGCFFTDKEQLVRQREQAMLESRERTHGGSNCDVIDVKL